MLGDPHYGALGTVLKIDPEHSGRIQLRFTVPTEPDFSQLFSQQAQLHERYEAGTTGTVYDSQTTSVSDPDPHSDCGSGSRRPKMS
jgi:hypothetical protein